MCNKTADTNTSCFNPASHIRARVKMEHQCFTSLLGEKANRRLHATPLATCRHSSSLRDNISSTGRHTSTSTMDVRSSLVERERLWRHLVARRERVSERERKREREGEEERGTVLSHYPPIIYLLLSLPHPSPPTGTYYIT